MELSDLLEDHLVDQEEGQKRLLTWFLNLVMQLEAVQQSGADPYERNESRTAQRNGYKERSLKTRVGDIVLKKGSSLFCVGGLEFWGLIRVIPKLPEYSR